MKVLPAGLGIRGAAAAAALLLTGVAISWFASPQSLDRRLTIIHLKSWLSAAAEWRSALGGSLVVWAAACGAAIVVLHTATSGVGGRIGAYRTGIATLVFFALTAGVALRPRIARLLPHTAAHRLSDLLSISWSIKPKTWQRMHIALAIGAMLPLWWHCDLGRASTADLLLECITILLVMSGFFGAAIVEPIAGRMLSMRLIKGWFAVHRGLAMLTGLLITVHVLAALYFVGV
jgi:hypothetical protein